MEENINEGIAVIRRLEDSLGTHRAFDLAKVYTGTQPGDFILLNGKPAEIFEHIIAALKSMNPQFDYRTRPQYVKDGFSVLSERHQKELEEHIALVKRAYPDMELKRGDDYVVFLYYNLPTIQQQEQSYAYAQNLVERVAAINEFCDVIDYGSALTSTKELIKAHVLIGTFFGFPPCCTKSYPTRVRRRRDFLAAEYEAFIEFEPCRPDCENAVEVAKLYRKVAECVDLDIEMLRELERDHFKGVLFLKGEDLHPKVEELAKRHKIQYEGRDGHYVLRFETRGSLTNVYHELREWNGVSITANTVLE